ncbi:heme oxygenase-like [Sesbania bispinosa]|nr:heme oxygenase-like [Sesbania bispinosa]
MSSEDFGSEAVPDETNSSSSFSALLSDNPPQVENLIPVEDSEETESDLDSQAKENRNTPVYQTFLTEVYTQYSIYTSPASIAKFHAAFLRNSAPLDCGFLLENEDLPDRLRQKLDKMPPKANVPRTLVNEKAMRRWLKEAGGEPDGQGRNLVHAEDCSRGPTKTAVQNVPPQQPTSKPTPTLTKAGAHTSSGTQGQAASSSLPPLADKWWTLFNNFEGPEGSKVNSIFDHRFNVERVVSCDFNKKEDQTRVNRVEMRNVGKHLMTMGMQTAFFGYCFDSGMNSADKELKERAHKIHELTEKLKASKKAADVKYNDLNTKYSDVIAQQLQLKKDLETAVGEKSKACEDLLAASEQKAQLEVDLKALQAEIAIQHARGFRKAIDQVKILNPTTNVEEVGVFKKIVDGKIVEESEDEDE